MFIEPSFAYQQPDALSTIASQSTPFTAQYSSRIAPFPIPPVPTPLARAQILAPGVKPVKAPLDFVVGSWGTHVTLSDRC